MRLFGQHRANQIHKTRFGRYFVYAIGEIILVVIGILIALQVNNWNQNRKDRLTEQIYLKQLIEDLSLQKEEIELQIETEKEDSLAITRLVKAINSDFEAIDTIQFHIDLSNLGDTRTFNAFNATYDELKSTGGIALISNQKIKNGLNSYYQKLNRYQSVLNKNSSEVIRFRLEDFYRKGLMIVDHDPPPQGMESIGLEGLINNIDQRSELRKKAIENLQKDNNLILLVNGLSSRNATFTVAMNTLREIKMNTENLRSEINNQLDK